jgi:hypothetical protein
MVGIGERKKMELNFLWNGEEKLFWEKTLENCSKYNFYNYRCFHVNLITKQLDINKK